MRHHLQGVLLLAVVFVALWGAVKLAAPALDGALTEDESAETGTDAPDDVVDLAVDGVVVDAQLSSDEVLELQNELALAGYDPGPIDGIMGPSTRAAIDAARADLLIADSAPDRAVLDRLRVDAHLFIEDLPAGVDWDQIADTVDSS